MNVLFLTHTYVLGLYNLAVRLDKLLNDLFQTIVGTTVFKSVFLKPD